MEKDYTIRVRVNESVSTVTVTNHINGAIVEQELSEVDYPQEVQIEELIKSGAGAAGVR